MDVEHRMRTDPNEKRNKYAIGKSLCYDIGILDSDFELLQTYAGEDGYTKQGMECDDDFLYFFHTGKKNNWIWVYDWDGNFQKKFKVPMVGESENLYIRGDKFIAAFNNFKDQTGDIYEMTLSAKPADPCRTHTHRYPHPPKSGYRAAVHRDRTEQPALGRRL